MTTIIQSTVLLEWSDHTKHLPAALCVEVLYMLILRLGVWSIVLTVGYMAYSPLSDHQVILNNHITSSGVYVYNLLRRLYELGQVWEEVMGMVSLLKPCL